MEYLHLKEQLSKILNDDVQNRQSIQEFRRNVFLNSDGLGFIISVVGVFVFTGLTAYQMQQLKELSQDTSLSSLDRNKLALIGGLQLYILFINLFLSLLRILGSRD